MREREHMSDGGDKKEKKTTSKRNSKEGSFHLKCDGLCISLSTSKVLTNDKKDNMNIMGEESGREQQANKSS